MSPLYPSGFGHAVQPAPPTTLPGATNPEGQMLQAGAVRSIAPPKPGRHELQSDSWVAPSMTLLVVPLGHLRQEELLRSSLYLQMIFGLPTAGKVRDLLGICIDLKPGWHCWWCR